MKGLLVFVLLCVCLYLYVSKHRQKLGFEQKLAEPVLVPVMLMHNGEYFTAWLHMNRSTQELFAPEDPELRHLARVPCKELMSETPILCATERGGSPLYWVKHTRDFAEVRMLGKSYSWYRPMR